MKFTQALDIIRALAKSQGFYGRLYQQLLALDEDQIAEFEQYLEDNHIETPLDLVLALEG